jgi:hypothetical protein
VGDFRHRALHHHALGVEECERVFGTTIAVNGKEIPVRWIAEQHIVEDCGYIPTLADWLRNIKPEPWMSRNARKLHVEQERGKPAAIADGDSAEGELGS